MATDTTEPAAVTQAPVLSPAAHRNLDRSLVHGMAWTAAVKWTCQLIVWLATFVVIRLLSPSDYGIMGMAMLYVGLIQLLSEFGVGTAVVTLPRLSRDQIAQLSTLAVGFGVAGFLLVCAAAVPLGWFFASPRLPAVTVAMGVGFVITALGVVPSALLRRDMAFKRLALYGGAQSLVGSATTLILAYLGFEYWSLVLGNLVGHGFFSLLAIRDRPLNFARPRRSSIGEALNLSTNVIVARVSWYVYSNADFLTVGRVLGQAALGVYNVAWSLATMAVDKTTAILGQVTPSVFAAAQSDKAALRRYLLRLTEALSLVTFPACIGIALVANEATVVLLGHKWSAVALPLQVLALFGTLRSITSFLTQILNVVGDSVFPMRLAVASAIVFPIAFYIGTRWGIEGVALTWIVCYPIQVIPLYHRVMKRIELPFGEYLLALWPALSGSGVMTVAVTATHVALGNAVSPTERLVASVTAGGVAYIGTIFVLHRSRIQNFRAVLSGSFARANPDGQLGKADPVTVV